MPIINNAKENKDNPVLLIFKNFSLNLLNSCPIPIKNVAAGKTCIEKGIKLLEVYSVINLYVGTVNNENINIIIQKNLLLVIFVIK